MILEIFRLLSFERTIVAIVFKYTTQKSSLIHLLTNMEFPTQQLWRLFLTRSAIIFSTLWMISCATITLPTSKEATFLENIEGKDDKYLAWGIGANNAEAETDALKAAVYAAMLGGAAGNSVALVSAQEQAKPGMDARINKFFDDPATWSRFVRSTSQGRIDPDKRLVANVLGKDGSGKAVQVQAIKLGVEVIVARKALREYLEVNQFIGGMRIGN